MKDIKELLADPQELPDDQQIVDSTAASLACVTLINAYCRDPEDVDWEDVQLALDHALRAFRLPGDYPERAFTAANAGDDEDEEGEVDGDDGHVTEALDFINKRK